LIDCNSQAQIIVAKREAFDFSRGEPPQEFLTFLRALEVSWPEPGITGLMTNIFHQVSDDVVLRSLVNVARVEKTLLFETRREASDIMRDMPGSGVAFTLDDYRVNNYGYDTNLLNLRLIVVNYNDPYTVMAANSLSP
jgi:structural maintenance of chromosomes protein 6